MVVKSHNTRPDDLNYWNVKRSFNNNEMENVDDDERSIALSVSLLLKNKNISQPDFLQLPQHLITSPNCQCHRSFHIFCTDLFPKDEYDIDMIHIHPAPRNHERDPSRRILSSNKKSRHRILEDNDTIVTSRSEPCHVNNNNTESQLFEKKVRIPPKLPPRTTSLNIPSTYRSFQTLLKYPPSIRPSKQQSSSFVQLQIRALSVFDQSPSASQLFHPSGPPPSPKTPTQESSMVFNPINTAPLRAISLVPHARNFNENEKKLINTPSVKNINYEDHAREYLSASDGSDNDDDEEDEDEDKHKALVITKPKSLARTQSLSRPGTSLRDRLLTHNTNRYLSLAEIYYSTFDAQKNLLEKNRGRLRAQARLLIPANDNDDALTTITKATTKTTPTPQSKSVFGFSKTASSMHFGHAAGRLGLHGSFEKWPQPLSRRTPIERKQEVTTLRLVTLPLVTS